MPFRLYERVGKFKVSYPYKLPSGIERYCIPFGVPRLLLEPREGTRGFYEKMHFVADPYVGGFLKKDLNPFQLRTFALSR